MAPHMVGLGGVNWSSTWGSVLGCGGHNGDFYLLCFWRKFPLQKETQWQKINLPTNPWNRKMLTIVIILQTPNCMWFTNFTFTDGEVSLLEIWRTKLPLRKKVEPRFACLSGFGLTTTSTLATTTPRPILGDHQVKPKLCYSLFVGRVLFTLNWKLW